MNNWQEHAKVFLDQMDVQGKKGVDVGCGVGWASLYLKSKGAEMVAMDTLPRSHYKLVDILKEGILYVTSLNGLEGFDFVWSNHVLEHIPNPIAHLLALRAVAKELWLAVPKTTLEGFAKDHINMYNMPVLVEHLRRAGWDVERGHYFVYPGPNVGSLWGVLKRHEGFIPGEQSTFSRYPTPMDGLNTEGENHLRVQMFEWNWENLNQ